jgi:hypothetical protein
MFPNQPKGKLTCVNVMGIGFDFIGFYTNYFRAALSTIKIHLSK